MSRRPVLYVLAGVNGAGKSSIGGTLLAQQGQTWFNPDTFARELMAVTGCDQASANSQSWREGVSRLDAAVSQRRHFAFETTLGGNTIPSRIAAAAVTHDVLMWFCGLASPEQHIARVRARVAAGGHDIPEDKIRERYVTSIENLIALMPYLHHLQVYDNSVDVAPGKPIPDPIRLLDMTTTRLKFPTSTASLRRTPRWATAIMEAALQLRSR